MATRKPIQVPSLQKRDIRDAESKLQTAPTSVWKLGFDGDHPILGNHRLNNEPVMPGLAYLDLIYQYFQELGVGYDEISLENLTLREKLGDPDGDEIFVENHVQAGESAGVWEFSVRLKDKPEFLFASCTVRRQQGDVQRRTKFIGEGPGEKPDPWGDLDETYEICRRKGLVHTDAMHAKGRVKLTTWGCVVMIRGEAFGIDNPPRFVHPAVMDGSAIASAVYFLNTSGEGTSAYLPLHIESFVLFQPILAEVEYAVEVRATEALSVPDLARVSISVFDAANGLHVAELTNLTSKLIPSRQTLEQPAGVPPDHYSGQSFRKLITGFLADRLGLGHGELDPEAGFYDLGLTSTHLMDMMSLLDRTMGRSLNPILPFEFTSVSALVRHLELSEQLVNPAPAPADASPARSVTPDSSAPSSSAPGSAAPISSAPVSSASMGSKLRPIELPKTKAVADDVAIIGLAGRYPRAKNIDEFWDVLLRGEDCVTEVPTHRWETSEVTDVSSPSGTPVSRWGGFIDDVECFDPLYFQISPRETKYIDPQERVFLEVAWSAIEDAGYTPEILPGKETGRSVGVFAGVMHNDYSLLGADSLARGDVVPLALTTASVANRVSYICDFHGPSMTIDSLCSSSLTAIHLAVQSILTGECVAAVAGGVNLTLHPAKYMTYTLMGMLSSDGKCRAFGEGGDGYVSAEGCGAAVLKPLEQAENDHDHIYAVIKSTMVNHGGRTSGMTVPSPRGQASLIAACLEKRSLSARTIGYVEAHGTGTSLGDPIEIEGLIKAFRRTTNAAAFCSIGSVKTNIGHAESAAGIAGLTKAVLQLKHRTLVPSLHAKEINKKLNLSESPFYIQQTKQSWQVDSQDAPRRAAVSAFGAGGSNAHIVLEEYPDQVGGLTSESEPALGRLLVFPLSAPDEPGLKRYATLLMDWLEDAQAPLPLASVAYVLQSGRVAKRYRFAALARNQGELIERLRGFVEGHEVGLAGVVDPAISETAYDAEIDATDAGSVRDAVAAWTMGTNIDWTRITQEPGRRIRVPAYPFARSSYWLGTRSTQNQLRTKVAAATSAHPLLHSRKNKWTVHSTFMASEPNFADHQVAGELMLPGVAHIEMAVAMAKGLVDDERSTPLIITNLYWLRPIVLVDGTVNVSLQMQPGASDSARDEWSFELVDDQAGEQRRVFSKGAIACDPGEVVPEPRDIQSIRHRMINGDLDRSQIYDFFSASGIEYGDSFKGLTQIQLGNGEVLGRIVVPNLDKENYHVYPAATDCALQACIGFVVQDSASQAGNPSVPFALRRFVLYRPYQRNMWAWARQSGKKGATSENTEVEIEILDDEGYVCAAISGLVARPVSGVREIENTNDLSEGLHALVPVWDVSTALQNEVQTSINSQSTLYVGSASALANLPDNATQPTLTLEEGHCEAEICEMLEGASYSHFVWLSDSGNIDLHQPELVAHAHEGGVFLLFRFLKALLKLGYQKRQVSFTSITFGCALLGEGGVRSAHAGIEGLLGSFALEQPRWLLRVLDLEGFDQWPASAIAKHPSENWEGVWAYREQQWLKQKLVPTSSHMDPVASRFKHHGVYVILGGAGGLGRAFGEYLASTYDATIVMLGRREQDEEICAHLDRLSALTDAKHMYLSVDATDTTAMRSAAARVLENFPCVDGLVHSAMVLADQTVASMSEEDFRRGFNAKAETTTNLLHAFAGHVADLVIMFSSVASFLKGPGQSNYSAGCTFKDWYSMTLADSKAYEHCQFSVVNWGYWGSVGIVADPYYQERMAKLGIGSIEVNEGVAHLERALAEGLERSALIKLARAQEVPGVDIAEGVTQL